MDITVIEIDFDRLERDVLRGAINDKDVQKLLPFQTKLGRGNTYVHIVNASAYTVETNSHFIRETGTLCAREGGARWTISSEIITAQGATCPGCLAKAKTIIVNHLLDNELL